ncbi:zf-CHY-domain-containing protein [Neocallimastix lanati (nom. inval.)]|jgi:hypothetical protein|uniref:Zf-CHY-domain-containing protein n=1 Tax=Neocallimastix californiae TaxID=1754190 RepID=A0A1Y2F200_9FUNG|nr:zf-CHY-domain-containing protein [Neocallimastix sp. JGI-2020a]ORY77912.1 zf-CHY-domain-containing protein [Neocallimastix californiae]|eukprot:ORY77912.1 zf-CHY-domain-containing protein [Neocallimastix californiae]
MSASEQEQITISTIPVSFNEEEGADTDSFVSMSSDSSNSEVDESAIQDDKEENEEQMKLLRLQKEQQEMRRKIISVQRDQTLSESEKAKKIQEIMTFTYKTKNHINTHLNEKVNLDIPLTEKDKAPTYNDEENRILGCKHYQRAIKFQASCCGKWFTCRFCHDSVSDHEVDRKKTTKMMCMYCNTVQKAGQKCIKCERCLARYYCDKCKLWDDEPKKSIYHCDDCGICRIGKGLGEDYFHCKKCNACLAISLKGNHKCIERNLESNCPICGEYMFTSTSIVIFMPCGHCIHYKCHQEYIQTNYHCPTCFKSLANMNEYFRRIDTMLQQHKMPPEYENWHSYILCNDCEKRSYAKYHFLYHKCAYCSSYNTKVLKTYETSQSMPSINGTTVLSTNTNENEHTNENINDEDGQ